MQAVLSNTPTPLHPLLASSQMVQREESELARRYEQEVQLLREKHKSGVDRAEKKKVERLVKENPPLPKKA